MRIRKATVKKTKPLKKQPNTKRPSWIKLPYPALINVLEQLSDKERVNTAQVCKSWKDAFHNPALWRQRHFDFGGPRANESGQNALAFVSSKGSFLQRVCITCRHVTSNTSQYIANTLEPFVDFLAQADLREFRLKDLELDRFWKYAHLRVKVGDCLLSLLHDKRNLEIFEMSSAQFGLLPGTELLETVAQACCPKLTTLCLPDFFHSRLAAFEQDRFRDAIQRFGNLKVVVLNYCCLFDDLIKSWATNLRGKLESIKLVACGNEPHEHVISDSSWKALASACPKLTVHLFIMGIGPSTSVIPILCPQAPVVTLVMTSGYDNDQPLQISETLHHISTSYGSRLAMLCIDFDNYQDDIDDALIHVIAQSKNLQHLKIKANSSVAVANAVCRLIRERLTRLTSVDITLCDLSDPDMEHLRDIGEEMEPVAQARGISLSLHNDLF